MTKIATLEHLQSRPHGIGWMETRTEAEESFDLCPCAWVDGYILAAEGNLFCLEDSRENYGQLKDGWGFRIWIESKPSPKQAKAEPWEGKET